MSKLIKSNNIGDLTAKQFSAFGKVKAFEKAAAHFNDQNNKHNARREVLENRLEKLVLEVLDSGIDPDIINAEDFNFESLLG